MRTLRTFKTERTLRTKKIEKALLIPEIKYKVTDIRNTHTSVTVLNLVYRVLKCKSEFSWISSVPGNARILHASVGAID